MPLNPIKSGYFSLLVALNYDLLNGRVTRNHTVSHPYNVLGRLMALIPMLSILLSVLLIAYLYFADHD